jgi:hypothetical protein
MTLLLSGPSFLCQSIPSFFGALVIYGLLLPAAAICDALGLDGFLRQYPGTIPNWLFLISLTVLAYCYSLTMALAVRGIIRFTRKIAGK